MLVGRCLESSEILGCVGGFPLVNVELPPFCMFEGGAAVRVFDHGRLSCGIKLKNDGMIAAVG